MDIRELEGTEKNAWPQNIKRWVVNIIVLEIIH